MSKWFFCVLVKARPETEAWYTWICYLVFKYFVNALQKIDLMYVLCYFKGSTKMKGNKNVCVPKTTKRNTRRRKTKLLTEIHASEERDRDRNGAECLIDLSQSMNQVNPTNPQQQLATSLGKRVKKTPSYLKDYAMWTCLSINFSVLFIYRMQNFFCNLFKIFWYRVVT